ncbi:MAG TPA: hypothetical protein PKZ24_03875 [Nitrospirales bacterium]|nr:hypothetical protein [Nitrospirales bacterium]
MGIKEWQFKLFISNTISPFGGNKLIQFKGIIGKGVQDSPSEGLIGRQILGDIEIPLELLENDGRSEQNANELGHIHFVSGMLGIKIRVSPIQFEVLFQTFAAFSGISNWNAFTIGFLIAHENWKVPDFWKGKWQTESPHIVEYNVISGGDFYSPDNRSPLLKLLFPRIRPGKK